MPMLLKSNGASRVKKKKTFRKFRDGNKNQPPELGPLKRNNNHYMNKLVKSIKRRCTTVKYNRTLGKNHGRNNLKRQLFKSPNRHQQQRNLNGQQMLPNGLNNVNKYLNNETITCLDEDSDDDCILVETPMDKITIDDDDNDDNVSSTSRAVNAVVVNSSSPSMSMTNGHNFPDSEFKTEKGNNKPLSQQGGTTLFYESFKKNFSRSNQRPKYFTEFPKLGNESLTKDNIILLDDSCDMGLQDSRNNNIPRKNEREYDNKLDESVIFVSESYANDFLPLASKDVPNPIFIEKEPTAPHPSSSKGKPIQKLKHSLFTAKEQKDLNAINCNAYNPAAENSKAVTQNKKRTVIVDGSNVAFGHSHMKMFSVEGLKICLDYFDKMGHNVKAVIPMFRKSAHKSTNPQLLEELEKLGKIVFTPCKNLPGFVSTSYDDRFIVQLACELDAAIISNDNYRDIIHESSAFKKLIENRVIGYTWCDDIFILPKDPYGRFGPTLDEILNIK